MKLTEEASAITTVSQLLAAVEPGLSAPMRAVVKTMIGHLSACVGRPFEQMPLSALIDADHVLTGYLRGQQRLKQSTINSYRKAAKFLFNRAKKLGCLSQNAEIPEAWLLIFTAAQKEGLAQIVRYAIRQGLSPSKLSDRDLDRWGDILIARKRQAAYAAGLKNQFRSLIRRFDLSSALPLISPQRNYLYGIPTTSMPPKLRQDISDILAFKQGKVWAPGLPRRARQGPVSAAGLEGEFCQLYGFAVRILGLNVDSLADLVTERIVKEFAGWLINERKLFHRTVILTLASLYAGVRYYATFRSTDGSTNIRWWQELIAEIEPEPESERQERKRRKCLPYEVVASIPTQLRERRNSFPKASDPFEWAFLLQCELLMTWLSVHAWRRRNLCQCKLGLQEGDANLFLAPLSATADIDLPGSVKDRLRVNPNEPFWQFRFLTSQMKKKRMMRGALPIQVVPLLEEYLPHRRELLARSGQDHDELFLNRDGQPFEPDDMTALVKKLTLRYAGRENPPHLFRTIVGSQFLRENPRDYLSLQKILGHTNPSWTAKIYGSNFDESSGVCVMEEWLLWRQAPKIEPVSTRDGQGFRPKLPAPTPATDGGVRVIRVTERPVPNRPAAASKAESSGHIPLLPVDATAKHTTEMLVSAELSGAAARGEGVRRRARAGWPTREQFVIVYGERGPRLTWPERAKVAGLPNADAAADGFQAALAAKLAAAG
jgi:Phage integrase family